MSESAGASRAGVVLPVLPVAEHPAWHEHAACRGKGPALFFPEPGKRTSYAEARQLCDGCPVHSECAAAGRTRVTACGAGPPRTSVTRGIRAGWRELP